MGVHVTGGGSRVPVSGGRGASGSSTKAQNDAKVIEQEEDNKEDEDEDEDEEDGEGSVGVVAVAVTAVLLILLFSM